MSLAVRLESQLRGHPPTGGVFGYGTPSGREARLDSLIHGYRNCGYVWCRITDPVTGEVLREWGEVSS